MGPRFFCTRHWFHNKNILLLFETFFSFYGCLEKQKYAWNAHKSSDLTEEAVLLVIKIWTPCIIVLRILTVNYWGPMDSNLTIIWTPKVWKNWINYISWQIISNFLTDQWIPPLNHLYPPFLDPILIRILDRYFYQDVST